MAEEIPILPGIYLRIVNTAEQIIKMQIQGTTAKTVIDLETLINTMRASGASDKVIREVLQHDLRTGGRIFGAFKNQFKATGSFAVGKMGSYGTLLEMEKRGLQEFKWQAVGKNICPDCNARHGTTGTMETFQMMGMPKSGFSVCGSHCNCELVPTGEWVSNPIKVPITE